MFTLLGAAGTETAVALEPVTVRSQSGQFIVRGLPFGAPLSGYSTSAVDYLRLDPTLTAVSLERIRHELLSELGIDPQARRRAPGLVRVNTHPPQDDDMRVRLTSVRFTDGWAYQLDLPERIDRWQFIRVSVQVILRTLANHHAAREESPLPAWLVEGLAAEIQATTIGTLALEANTHIARREQNFDPLKSARGVLQRQSPLKFDELSMPSEDGANGSDTELFRACAQVFVHDLLRLRDGRKCVGEMLAGLHENLNWQTTFLRVFHSDFPKLVDVDKWYSVNIASFTGRELMSIWPVETTLTQLDNVLATSVEVRATATDLPVTTTVSLQRILGEWEFSRQYPVLARKIQQLYALRLRGAPEVRGLVDGYIKTLATYAAGGLPSTATPAAKSQPAGRARGVVKTATRQLDALDAQRETLGLRTVRSTRRP